MKRATVKRWLTTILLLTLLILAAVYVQFADRISIDTLGTFLSI